jgi:hypothetical protein
VGKIMKIIKWTLFIVIAFSCLEFIVLVKNNNIRSKALDDLYPSKGNASWDAIKYLASKPNETIPILKEIFKKKDKRWIHAGFALTRTGKEEVLKFYIELLKDNFYEKEENGEKAQFGLGSKNGCIVFPYLYGGFIAEQLGKLGDKRAIPVLKQAIEEGDSYVKQHAYEALYHVGGISLDELILAAKNSPLTSSDFIEIILSIGWENIHSNNAFAVKIYDMIIQNFSDPTLSNYQVASAHYWKIQCYELMGRDEDALQECDATLKYTQFKNLTSQAEKEKINLIRKIDSFGKKQ